MDDRETAQFPHTSAKQRKTKPQVQVEDESEHDVDLDDSDDETDYTITEFYGMASKTHILTDWYPCWLLPCSVVMYRADGTNPKGGESFHNVRLIYECILIAILCLGDAMHQLGLVAHQRNY